MAIPEITLEEGRQASFIHPFPFKRTGFRTLENLTANFYMEANMVANLMYRDASSHTPISLAVVSNKSEQLLPLLRTYATHFDQLIVNWTNGKDRLDTQKVKETLGSLEQRFEHLQDNITLQESYSFNNDFARTREAMNDASKNKWVFHLDDDEQISRPLLATMQQVLAFMDYAKRTVGGIPRENYVDGVFCPVPAEPNDWQYRIVTKDIRYQHPVHAQPTCLFTPEKERSLVLLHGAKLTHKKTAEQHNASQDLYRMILPGSEGPKISTARSNAA